MAGPWAGLQVVEFTGIGPGPFCAMMLAEPGAEVGPIARPGAALDRNNGPKRGRSVLELDLRNVQRAPFRCRTQTHAPRCSYHQDQRARSVCPYEEDPHPAANGNRTAKARNSYRTAGNLNSNYCLVNLC